VIEYHVIGKVVEEGYKGLFFDLLGYSEEIDLYCNPIKYNDENIFKYSRFLSHGKSETFKCFKECFIISSEIEFKNYDIIQYKGKDYTVNYKYNGDLQQHELHIDFIVETIELDKEFIKQCEDNWNKIMEYRDDYFKRIEKENKVKNENTPNTMFNKLKRIFTRK